MQLRSRIKPGVLRFWFPAGEREQRLCHFECYQPDDADRIAKEIPFKELIFARQMIVVGELLKNLPENDRISPIMGMLTGVVERAGDLRVEVPDTNEAKELMKFCRKFTVPLRSALRQEKLLLAKRTGAVRSFTFSLSRRAVAMSVILTRIITLRSTWGSRV